MTDLFKAPGLLSRLNNNALNDPRVNIVTADAFIWLRESKKQFDVAIVDFPDPSNFSLGKLYSQSFYRVLKTALRPNGLVTIQSTSPYFAKNSYWCVVETLKSTGFETTPYHAYVPSFGDWGYVIGSLSHFAPADSYPSGLHYVTSDSFKQMLAFPPDMVPTVTTVNKLNNQTLVHMFEKEWGDYVETH